MASTTTKFTVKGGDKATRYLQKLADDMKNPPILKVGFLDGATYDNGMNTATVGLINEFGATINMPDRQQTIYRKKNAKGTGFLRNGKFVKKPQPGDSPATLKRRANFASTHDVAAHTYTIPPRPFFRNMIAANKGSWGSDAGKMMLANKLDIKKTASQMGKLISGQLRKSIATLSSPPNAPSTIRKKKSAKPLVDTGFLLSRVDFSVD